MGLADWLIKKTAKSTANSMGKYVNSGQFGNKMDSLRVWSSTRSKSMELLFMIDNMLSSPFTRDMTAAELAHILFNLEMGIKPDSLSSNVTQEIRLIFKNELGYD